MNQLTLHPSPPPDPLLRVRPPAAYVDGRRRRDLSVQRWSLLEAPQFGSAAVIAAWSGLHRRAARLEQAWRLPGVGSRLQVRLPGPGGAVVFDGTVTRHRLRAEAGGEDLSAEAEDSLAVRLAGAVAGRWQTGDDAPVFVSHADAVFNDPPDGLASPTLHALSGRTCRVFQPDGQWWSLADILDYLLAACVPSDVSVCGLAECADVLGGLYPPRVSLAGLSAAEALVRAAGLAGLRVRGGTGGEGTDTRRSLVFYRPGQDGPRRDVRLQPAGRTLDLRASNLQEAQVTFGVRPGRPTVVALGGPKRHEATFTLQRGWDGQLATYHHRDFTRSESADWPRLADVFRRWVLNETGRYCPDPYGLERFDLSEFLGEDFLTFSGRRLEGCLSRGPSGEPLGVVVEVSYDGGQTFLRYPGALRALAEECGVYLADDALPADYFQAALAGQARVRVTGTVPADRRISAQVPGDSGAGTVILRVPSAAWARVHPTSVFAGRDDLPPADQRDDSAFLLAAARGFLPPERGASVEAELLLAFLDPTRQVGDRVEKVAGRELDLAALPGCSPCVRAVEHLCGADWSTRLKVSG